MRTAVFIGLPELIDKSLIERLQLFHFHIEQFNAPEDFLFEGEFIENCIYFIFCSPGHISGNNLIKIIRLKDKVSLIYSVAFDESNFDLMQSLYAGADFSVKVPIHLERCVSEIQNHFRKIDHLTKTKKKGGVELISEGHTILRNGMALKLTVVEFKIFNCLFENLNRILSREEIISSIPLKDSAIRTVDAHICSLRRKIDSMSLSIDTVRGKGYQLGLQK